MVELIQINKDNALAFRPLIREDAYPFLLDPDVFALGLVNDDTAFAAAVFRVHDGGEAELLSIAVSESGRRQGYGTELLVEATDFMVDRMDVIRLSCDFVEGGDDKEAFKGFLKYLEFETEKQAGGCYRISLKKLRENRLLEGGSKDCRSVADLTTMERKLLYREEMDLKPLEEQGWIEEQVSCVKQDGPSLSSVLIFTKGDGSGDIYGDEPKEGALCIQWARSDSDNPAGLLSLFRHAMKKLESYPEDTEIYVPVLNEASERLAEKILGEGAEKIEQSYHAELDLEVEAGAE
ncbi:MAG: GNAT family N-acetyltransferase [Lachnospiraceae bacterium]|nr:GNAT family N-acetyltransferase [Lachnospiraceae bacterium]